MDAHLVDESLTTPYVPSRSSSVAQTYQPPVVQQSKEYQPQQPTIAQRQPSIRPYEPVNNYSSQTNEDVSSTKYQTVDDSLATPIFVLCLAYTVYQVLYFLIDIIDIGYYGNTVEKFNKAGGKPPQTFVGHLTITILHFFLFAPSMIVDVFGFLSVSAGGRISRKTQGIFGIVYAVGLIVLLIVRVILNISDHAQGTFGIGFGYGWSNGVILSVILITLSFMRYKRLRI
jgi:hypothetical protein